MNPRDDLLRANVYAAFDARGTDAYAGAVADVVDGWMLWPRIAARRALEQSRRDREELDAQIADALELLRGIAA